MKTYRRIEVTAFRRRVTIVCGDPMTHIGEAGVSVSDADSQEMIETASEEGQEILIEAVPPFGKNDLQTVAERI